MVRKIHDLHLISYVASSRAPWGSTQGILSPASYFLAPQCCRCSSSAVTSLPVVTCVIHLFKTTSLKTSPWAVSRIVCGALRTLVRQEAPTLDPRERVEVFICNYGPMDRTVAEPLYEFGIPGFCPSGTVPRTEYRSLLQPYVKINLLTPSTERRDDPRCPLVTTCSNHQSHLIQEGCPVVLPQLAYQLKSRDNDLRFLFHLDAPCGIITFIMSSFAALLIASALISIATVSRNEKISQGLQDDADQKLPRKESVLDIRPAYNCIHKHLKQTDVFQEKAKRTLWKERLEIEIMNSRISCMNKLLHPEAPKSQWRKSRSPKVFCRNMEAVTA